MNLIAYIDLNQFFFFFDLFIFEFIFVCAIYYTPFLYISHWRTKMAFV